MPQTPQLAQDALARLLEPAVAPQPATPSAPEPAEGAAKGEGVLKRLLSSEDAGASAGSGRPREIHFGEAPPPSAAEEPAESQGPLHLPPSEKREALLGRLLERPR